MVVMGPGLRRDDGEINALYRTPLVLATGAGANARKSIGITVFSGMIASTCLAVLFVPTFFVVVQRFENWLAGRKGDAPSPQTIPQAPSVTH